LNVEFQHTILRRVTKKTKKKERGRHENFWPVIGRHVAYVAAPKLEGEIGRRNVTTERKLN
jgi:hypothetical protein